MSLSVIKENQIRISPKPHQYEALGKAIYYYKSNKAGKLIMPCGSGKTLTALWIADGIGAKRIIVVLPTLQLQSQALKSWMNNLHVDNLNHDVILIGSDNEIGSEYGLQATTDPLTILNRIKKAGAKPVVILTTYHSSHILLDIATANSISFDLCIFDEAHHTAGVDKKRFQAVISRPDFKVDKKLFMTATPKVLQARKGQEDMELISMDNEEIYGQEIYRLDTREAIKKGIICDYKIITMHSTHFKVSEGIVNDHRISDYKNLIPTGESRMIGIAISIVRSFQQLSLKHVIGFTSSIKRNKEFANIIKGVCESLNYRIDVFEINNTHSEIQRNKILSDYTSSDRAIIVNSKLLGEGFDMPAVDAVAFVDEKSSVTDIVQAAGRCWRVSPGKQYGYILLPLLVNENQKHIDNKETVILRRVVSALMSTDDLLLNYFKSKKSNSSSQISEIIGSIDLPVDFNGELLLESIKPSLWQSANLLALKETIWATHEEAAKFTLSLGAFGVVNKETWQKYCKDHSLYPGAPEKPANVPVNLTYFYKENFVPELFFVNGRSRKDFLPANEASKFTLSLKRFGVTNSIHWLKYCKDHSLYPGSPKKPYNIPVYLGDFYKENFKAELFFSDSRSEYSWLPAEEAAKFTRSLSAYGVTNTRHWIKYWRNHKLYKGAPKCPKDIPLNLSIVYKDQYNASLFFPESKKEIQYATAEEASIFTRSLSAFGIINTRHWTKYCKDHTLYPGAPEKPTNIPSTIHLVYKEQYSPELFFSKGRNKQKKN